MLKLMLLRHAKAKRPEGVDDFDRKLSGRGREAATRLGKVMHRQGLVPELALVSSSRRTRETWERVVEELDAQIPVREAKTLYLAGPSKIMEQLQRVPDEVRSVVVVGHNPGIGTLASRLAGEELEFPTGALAVISFEVSRWEEIERGKLENYFG